MNHFRDRAYCSRSGTDVPRGLEPCCRESCDRYVSETVQRLADKARLPIGYADLKTSKCGFVPREGK